MNKSDSIYIAKILRKKRASLGSHASRLSRENAEYTRLTRLISDLERAAA